MNKGTIKVNIFGQEYPIVGDQDTSYIQELAQVVDSEMRKNSEEAPMLPASRIAVLTCLNIMDRFMKYKMKHQQELKEILTQVDDLLGKLNQETGKKH
ncbi:MAG: cell division protein ZapA [Candidatus Aureabacteria bacterium]|nr:cell division protein ZapA [Candidatus Auribacterota bacterium]